VFSFALASVTGERYHFYVVDSMVLGLKGEQERAAAKSKFL